MPLPANPLCSLWRNPIHLLAFGFGAGTVPGAPGTAGTVVAVPLYLFLGHVTPVMYMLIVVAMFVLGVWLCGRTSQDLGIEDHPGIVWDEIVGFLVAMFMAPSGWLWIVTGFGLFRLFDIVKPFPIRQLEKKLPGGMGIMLDDVLAGVYAAVILQIIVLII